MLEGVYKRDRPPGVGATASACCEHDQHVTRLDGIAYGDLDLGHVVLVAGVGRNRRMGLAGPGG